MGNPRGDEREETRIYASENQRASRVTTGGETYSSTARPKALGKSLFLGDQKLYVRGVTYGTFRPDDDSAEEFPSRAAVAADFAGMAANGINAVRTYTVPPRWLLDLAAEHGLWVMAGLPWEQHITFIDEPGRVASIERQVREGVRACAGHPAFCASRSGTKSRPRSCAGTGGSASSVSSSGCIARPSKRTRMRSSPMSTTRAPSTCTCPFIDVCCFNVFLEAGSAFESYLSRLQNIAGDRPLILTETGLDSLRNSEEAQAALDEQDGVVSRT